MPSYNAPALRFQVRRSRFLWCGVLGVAVAGGLALLGWSRAGAPPSAFALAGAVLLIVYVRRRGRAVPVAHNDEASQEEREW